MTKPIKYANIADLYDTCVQTALDIPFFLDQLKHCSGEVLELMSGTGRVSVPLIEAGAKLTCVDKSPEMLAILQQKLDQRGLSATLQTVDVCELECDQQFDLILLPFHSFAELLTAAEQGQALDRIYAHLSVSGRFICSLHNPSVRLRSVDGKLHLRGHHPLAQDQGTLLLWSIETYSPETKLVQGLQFFETYNQRGIMESKRLMEIQFSVLDQTTFESLVQQAGFEILDFYGDYDASPFQANFSPFMIWILGKTPVQE
jgi:SAM-dependent methyltransferase